MYNRTPEDDITRTWPFFDDDLGGIMWVLTTEVGRKGGRDFVVYGETPIKSIGEHPVVMHEASNYFEMAHPLCEER